MSSAEEPSDTTERTVKPFELFFDLVFVFGFTQVTALMAHEGGWTGIAQGLLVLAAVWWAWGGYVWLATTIDLEEGATRLVMIGVMGMMFVAALAIPGAFSSTGVLFAVAYGLVRLLHIPLYAVAARGRPQLLRNVASLVPGTVLGPGLILASAFVHHHPARELMFLTGLVLDYGGAFLAPAGGWHVSPHHFHERHGLIVLIALGEALLAAGASLGDNIVTGTVTAALLAMVLVCGIWWTYFDVTAVFSLRVLAQADAVRRAVIARNAFSILHLPMVAGMILLALGVKKVLLHLHGPLPAAYAFALCGGVATYLAAMVLFRLHNVHTVSRSRTVAVGWFLLLAFVVAPHVAALTLLALAAVSQWALVSWEALRYREARLSIRSGARWQSQ